MRTRVPIFPLLAVLAVLASAVPADAQKHCVKGKPCGNTCIARNKTCRVGTGTATAAPRRTETTTAVTRSVTVPGGARFVASSRGRVYYWTGCNAWKSLAPANLRFFTSREEAEPPATRHRVRAVARDLPRSAAHRPKQPTPRLLTPGGSPGPARLNA